MTPEHSIATLAKRGYITATHEAWPPVDPVEFAKEHGLVCSKGWGTVGVYRATPPTIEDVKQAQPKRRKRA